MNFIKRIFLFILINLLVVLTITTLLNVFKLEPYLSAHGLNINSLAIFCLLWGFIGAFISLLLSKKIAKWAMRVQIIDETHANGNLKFVFDSVKKISEDAGLEYMPEVGVYNSNEVNAFATGPSKKRSLIALSSGLINKMSKDEVEAIIGHEISHIRNGDMITMTLLQGVVNAFVMFLARILAFVISSSNRKSRSSYSSNYFFVYLFEIIFMILGSFVLAFYSRKREFRADENSAKLLGKEKMIKALQTLKSVYDIKDLKKEKLAIQSLKISNNSKRGLLNLFSTHPPLDDRIDRLKEL
ncbi:MAG: Protease HtpX [Candidatus Anoxychlamydiales bacterium]|nr:Protease HtpX [Candidatus Anoxychlamydiales bacterium]NGX41472.1 Protease HtpX [Candidatus Anoxychlamydiales bacterium]HEU64572.1 protease HtpX [Chlamydiota bacterium]